MTRSTGLAGVALAAVLVSPVVVSQEQEPTRLPPQGAMTMRPEILGRRGIVAAGRHYTVAAGVRMLQQGGNAIDAGVAAVFAAAVTEISHFGLGGEAPAIIYDARTGRVAVVNGQGPAPKAATPDLFRARNVIDGNGPLAATVPAVVDAMALALEQFGTMGLAEVLAPAIELADGFPMYGSLRDFLISEREATLRYRWGYTYYQDGRVPEVGEVFRQPQLARTLRAIVDAERAAFEQSRDRRAAIRAGRDAFYQGDVARRIVEANRAEGGIFTLDDLATYRGRLEDSVSTTFHGYAIHKAGPWNQGPVLLQTLNILEGFDLRRMGHNSADYLHTVHEAIKLAYADRNAFYGDPDFVVVPIAGLLSKQYAAERRRLIGPRAMLDHRPGDPYRFDPTAKPPAVRYVPGPQGVGKRTDGGDTTAVSVVDGAGNLFSATPSSGWLLGGAFIAGDTGVPLSNRMQVFDLDPLSPNALAGGKRPRTTLTPTVVLRDGKPFLAVSTPGGDSQDQQILNVLLALLVFDLPLQQAIEAPRVNSLHPFSSFGGHESEPGVLEVERRVPAAVIKALERRGHLVRLLDPYGMSTGIVAVGVDPRTGTLRGGADVRRERYAFGW